MTEFPLRLRCDFRQTIPAWGVLFCVLFALPLFAADTPPSSSVQDIISEDRENAADSTEAGETAKPEDEIDSANLSRPPQGASRESDSTGTTETTATPAAPSEEDSSALATGRTEKADQAGKPSTASPPPDEAVSAQGARPAIPNGADISNGAAIPSGETETGATGEDIQAEARDGLEDSPIVKEGAQPASNDTPASGASGAFQTDSGEVTREDKEAGPPLEENLSATEESSKELEPSTKLEPGTEESAGSGEESAGAADGTAGKDGARDEEVNPDTPTAKASIANPFAGMSEEELFPTSPGIERQKEFWIQIFTHYSSHQGLLHDKRVAFPVYESIDLTGLRSRRAQSRYVKKAKRLLAARLQALARALDEDELLTGDQEDLLSKIPADSTAEEIREFAVNIRFQRGLADRFPEGLIRSGAVLEKMRAILIRHNVPGDIVYLPHVESTFNNNTRSKYGAMGIWQFTRGTGRLFMNIKYELDERLDPIIASRAAGKFLRQNYEKLGNWPLAITAYNHGPQSLVKISRRLETTDLGVLIEHYNGRLFKFASKNFYAEFLAAREVAKNYQKYFGELDLKPPLEFAEAPLPFYMTAKNAAKRLDISLKELKDLNPALRYPVWSGSKFIPKAYALRIPKSSDPRRFLASIPSAERMKKQKRAATVRVAPGDSLFRIGKRLGIPWKKIAMANNLTKRSKLYPGQRLVIPWKGKLPPSAIIKAAKLASAKIQPKKPASSKPKSRTAARPPSRNVLSARIGNVPNDPSGNPRFMAHSFGKVQASLIQDLHILNYNSKYKYGEVISAYGESLGKYADWAEVNLSELRGLNQMSPRARLYPGRTISIPLHVVSRDSFDTRRRGFHIEREANFLAEYDITSMRKVKVRPGQSPWNIAQTNNVPMWLFYRENPALIKNPMLPGMKVILPVLREGGPIAGANDAR